MWPRWFLKQFADKGPFAADRAGEPYVKRDDMTPVRVEALPGAHMPACQACNSVLDTKIERPAEPVVKRILEHGDSRDDLALSADERGSVARWLLKVGLLSAHPQAVHDHVGVNRDENRFAFASVRPEWLEGMSRGVEPPRGFSVFVTRCAISSEDD